jgi:hypothetical protein
VIEDPADVGLKQAVQRRDNQAVCGMPQDGNEKDEPRSESLWKIAERKILTRTQRPSQEAWGLCENRSVSIPFPANSDAYSMRTQVPRNSQSKVPQ